MTAHRPKVGFLGVGSMGRPMVDRILLNFDVILFNRSRVRAESLRGEVEFVDSPRELASACDIVFLCLPTLQAHRDILDGEKSLLAGRRARIVVQTGTTGPSLVREMEKTLAARSVALVDVPFSGGPARASRGDLVSMVRSGACAGCGTPSDRLLQQQDRRVWSHGRGPPRP